MAAPKAIRINGRQWRVDMVPLDQMDSCYGLCHYSKGLIEVATCQDPFDTRDTLLHESMHAILAQQGRSPLATEEEELYVRALSTGLIGVLQDNPEFAKWLIQPIPRTTS